MKRERLRGVGARRAAYKRPGLRRERLVLGRPSEVLQHLSDLASQLPRITAFVYMRESTHAQRRTNNLANRERDLRSRLNALRIQCSEDRYMEVADGRKLENRSVLEHAIADCRAFQRAHPERLAIVATDARNRFLRGRYFDGRNITDILDNEQRKALRRMSSGVPLVTVEHPDEVSARAHEDLVAKRSGRQYGRPKSRERVRISKKGRRHIMLPEVVRLIAAGFKNRAVARRTGVAESTIRHWRKRPEARTLLRHSTPLGRLRHS